MYRNMSIKLSFEKTINSKMLKLSVADVHSSFTVLDVAMATCKFHAVLAKNLS